MQARYDGAGRPLEPRDTRLDATPLGERARTLSIAAVEPAAPRPRATGRRDVRLRQARLDDALRMLAHEGGFSLVLPGELPRPVTVELTNVDPYDALLSLAEAYGLAVRYEGGVVVVESPRDRPGG